MALFLDFAFYRWRFINLFFFALMMSQFVKAEISPDANAYDDYLLSDPSLTGPDNLCIIFGSAMADFSGGGNPATDVYTWTITAPNGTEHFSRSGGATFQNISVTFSTLGVYRVNLSVRRGTENIYNGSKDLSVIQGPELVIEPDYLLCGSDPTTITAINPNTPNIGQYTFEWTNSVGDVIGNQNQITVQDEGYYYVTLFLSNNSGGNDCQINGGTYVGQPFDFRMQVNSTSICLGQNVFLSTDTPLMGEWLIRRDGQADWTSFGTGFNLNLDSEEDLFGIGTYRALFRYQSPEFPGCDSEREISFAITEDASFNISDVVNATDCNTSSGSFTFEANSNLEQIRINELAYVQNNLTAGQQLNFDNLFPGIYTVEIQNGSCGRTEVVIVPNGNPDPAMLFDVIGMEETCTETGKTNGALRVNMLNGLFTGTYRVVESNASLTESGNLNNQSTFDVSLPAGDYAIELIAPSGCKLPFAIKVNIPVKELVPFSVPDVLTICEEYQLIPSTEEPLTFRLTYPDGTQLSRAAGQAFPISESGDYTLLGENPSGPKCPNIQTFRVNVVSPIDFEPNLAFEDCFGNKMYEVELFGRDPSTVSIRWYDEQNRIVGRGINWYPTAYGNFFLEVQPRGSSFCAITPKPFTVREPVFQVAIDLSASVICEGGTGNVSMQTDFNEVSRIEWIFIDADNNQRNLPEFEDLRDIEVDEPGTYEVVVFNHIGCEIGRDWILILGSTDDRRPEVDPFYSICTESDFGETVTPGVFETYAWFRNGEYIGNSPTLRLSREGNYQLIVTNADGCEFEASFSTFEDCTFNYVMPNGMYLNNPQKQFEVYVNDAVDIALIWIHNRQGELIFHCEGQQVQSRVAFCQWDGTMNGKKIPLGLYTVTLKIISSRFGVEKKITQSLKVLE